MKIEEITFVINDCFEAVDRSKVGPLFMYQDPTNPMDKQVNQVAFNVFLQVISARIRDVQRSS